MKIIFVGEICSGCGRFKEELKIPNCILELDYGWLKKIEQGTLNVRISFNKCKSNIEFSDKKGVKVLDRIDEFKPQIYLPYNKIEGNTLTPQSTGNIYRGDAQFWRATIENKRLKNTINCYMLRRVCSGYTKNIELIGEVNFKKEMNYIDGDEVIVTVFSSGEARISSISSN